MSEKGGCGHCPHTRKTCYELRRTDGICGYDGVFTEIEYDECPYRLAPTNADRIRSLSDEGLAMFINSIDTFLSSFTTYIGAESVENVREWLKERDDRPLLGRRNYE